MDLYSILESIYLLSIKSRPNLKTKSIGGYGAGDDACRDTMQELSGINVRDVEVFAQSHAVAIAAVVMTGKEQNLCLSLKSIQTSPS